MLLTASEIIQRYITFFVNRGHKRIPNSPLVPENDPTTLFTSSGMQPLIPYLMGQEHPEGTRLVNVQNCFRAVDIDEIGNSRHTTFFRMLGNWSLGDYFKKEEIPWLYEFLTNPTTGLCIDPAKLHFTVFKGFEDIPQDNDAYQIWEEVLQKANVKDYKDHLSWYGAEKNWWSRSGTPDKMPAGEIGGPDTEVFYDFGANLKLHEKSKFKGEPCHPNCDCGRYWEIANSVFMQYKKNVEGKFEHLPKQNVDFGGGLERLLGAAENQTDIFQTSLFKPTITTIEKQTKQIYTDHKPAMQIIADHLGAAIFIANAGVTPSKTDQGYILRRLIRRALDNFYQLKGQKIDIVLETIVNQYKATDPDLEQNFEKIKYVILEEEQKYHATRKQALTFIEKKYNQSRHDGDVKEISAEDAFNLYTTHGLSPTQIESLGYYFDSKLFLEKMEEHQNLSRKGAEKKFKGGLADHEERTIMGHTATHLLHQALRNILGNQIHQTGSNITTERVRFDFNYDKRLTDEEIKKVEDLVNKKIKENLPVHFELISTQEAHKIGAIGLFMDTYGEKSKIYFIGDTSKSYRDAFSIEFCGGPHVDFTGKLKSFTIIKQENLGKNQKRIYALVG